MDPVRLRRARPSSSRPTSTRRSSSRCAAELPDLAHVWQFDDGALDDAGRAGADVSDDEVDQAPRRRSTLDDLASIIYTSGTTGRPKGCELTHRSFVTEVAELHDAARRASSTSTTSTLLFLPIAHVFGRVIEIGALARRLHARPHRRRQEPARRPRRASSRPSCWPCPRVFEKVYNTRQAEGARRRQGQDLRPRRDGRRSRYSRGPRRRARRRCCCKLQHAVFDRLVYGKLRAALGGNCVAAVSGGAPLGARLGPLLPRHRRRRSTRATASPRPPPASTVNRPDAIKIGTVGRPVGGVDRARSPTTASCCSRRRIVFARLLAATRTPPPRRSTPTAGSTPATSARSTTTASSGSPAARRSSSSPPAARTSRRPCSRTACARTGWSASAWSSATRSRSSPRWSRIDPEALPAVAGAARQAGRHPDGRPRRRRRPARRDPDGDRRRQQGRQQGRVDPQVHDPGRRTGPRRAAS